MAENEVNSVEDYRQQLARLRNAVTVLRVETIRRLDECEDELERLRSESHGQSQDSA